MGVIVTISDFTLNQSLPLDELAGITSILQDYIDKYEPEALDLMLSVELSAEFQTAIALPTPSQKWLDLRDGAIYTYNAIKYRFNGLKIAATNYIFFKYSTQNQESSTSVGIKNINSENADRFQPKVKQIWSYNEMAQINNELTWFIPVTNTETPDTYPNYISTEIVKLNIFNI